jgi:hypothetical protein
MGRSPSAAKRKRQADKQEGRLINAIEKVDVLRRYDSFLQKMEKGTLDVPGFMKEVARNAAIKVAQIMDDEEAGAKVQLAAAQDILDRAGYNKTTKHLHAGLIGNVDVDSSKMELINIILSSAKKVGFRTEDPRGDVIAKDQTPLPAPADGEVLDVIAQELKDAVPAHAAPKTIVDEALGDGEEDDDD